MIRDNALRGMLQKYICHHDKWSKEKKLFSVAKCGSQLMIPEIGQNKVFVLSNGTTSKFFGTISCHSSWACPACTAVTMAKYGGRIGALIDAMKVKYQCSPIMITLTLPHTRKIPCKNTLEILKDAWRKFVTHTTKKSYTENYQLKSNRKLKGQDKKGVAGEFIQITRMPQFAKFRTELEIKHFVRVYEVTWGKNGWHPHLHILFFIPDKNLDKVLSYEEKLLDSWWKILQRSTAKFMKKQGVAEDRIKKYIEGYYNDARKYPKTGHRSLFISREKGNNNAVKVYKSSHYISGWGGDMEVTGNYKREASGHTSKSKHYTPFQMLDMAKATDNLKEREKWLELFIEYAIATHSSKRVHFSKGANTIIDDWLKSEQYIQTMKKKAMDKAAEQMSYKVVAWFNKQQWSRICWWATTIDFTIHAEILKRAKNKGDPTAAIFNYLDDLGIHCWETYEIKDHEETYVESLFENYRKFA